MVDAQAGFGRVLGLYAEAIRFLERDEVAETYVSRRKADLMKALDKLVDAAQQEGEEAYYEHEGTAS